MFAHTAFFLPPPLRLGEPCVGSGAHRRACTTCPPGSVCAEGTWHPVPVPGRCYRDVEDCLKPAGCAGCKGTWGEGAGRGWSLCADLPVDSCQLCQLPIAIYELPYKIHLPNTIYQLLFTNYQVPCTRIIYQLPVTSH